MNQPKFKMGDKLKLVGIHRTITVQCIFLDKGCYFYRENQGEMAISESLLELYQERKKKKLYAHEFANDGEIHFFKCEMSYSDWNHVPEYDLDYPPTKEGTNSEA